MSRHESVSCDSCMKGNFKGRRYKCLVCYDYDLCSTCHEAGVTSGRHTTDHAMQCILTRSDFDVYYGGDSISPDHPQSFTCPYCGQMGYTESTLSEHVTNQHSDNTAEVICPICAALPGGDPNLVSNDFPAHLDLEHRSREPFEIESLSHRNPRRLGSSRRGGPRPRHYNPNGDHSSSANSSSLSIDPIAELLSHLSGVHSRINMRNAQQAQQLRDIRSQIEAERARLPDMPPSLYREHLQRLPSRRSASYMFEPPTLSSSASNGIADTGRTAASVVASSQPPASNSNAGSKTLLSRYLAADTLTGDALEEKDKREAEHSIFLQDVLLASLTSTQLQVTNTDNSTEISTNQNDSTSNRASLNDIVSGQRSQEMSPNSQQQRSVRPKLKTQHEGS